MQTIRLRRPFDMHAHFRQGDMLRKVLPHTVKYFAGAIAMPNTLPDVLTGDDAIRYLDEIMSCVPSGRSFRPLMTIKLTDATTPKTITAAYAAGVIAGKAYPVGTTTNSAKGVTDFYALTPVFLEMERVGMVLELHGETTTHFCLDREAKFLPILKWLVDHFPRLKIVLEHITTAEGIRAVEDLPDTVAGSITTHHLYLTLDDVVGDKLEPHNFCKPIAKRPEDRTAVQLAALSGDPKFFLGTDTAPHSVETKECEHGCAGVYSAPTAMPATVQFFAERGLLNNLEAFTSLNGPRFYGIDPSNELDTYEQRTWLVPHEIDDLKPFLRNQEITWQLADTT